MPQAQPEPATDRYRIGLLVDQLEVSKWAYDLAQWASDHPQVELAAIIVDRCARRRLPSSLVFELESALLRLSGAYRPYTRRYSIGGRAPVEVETGPNGFSELAQLNLDAVVCCSNSPAIGEIFAYARDGVVSLVAGSGDPAECGFADVLHGRPETPFTIALFRAGGKSEILVSGSIATELSHAANRLSLHARAFPYVQQALEQLANGVATPQAGEQAERNPTAGAVDILSYGARTAKRSFGKGLRRILRREFNWQVAFTPERWGGIDFSQATIVPNPDGAFLADPFTIELDGTHYLFVEEYPFATRKGVISAYRLEGDRAERIGVVLEKPYHLSFPFVFRHAGEIYMVPESGADRSVRLYRSDDFPGGWTEVKVLLEGVKAADTILFEHDQLWWMLTTIPGEGPALNNAELHAFYAADPLGDWTPHPLNPVVIDSRKGRNGGFVRDVDGRPCRVAQVPGFTFYGASSAVYRIDELSPAAYRETLVEEVRPTFFENLDGTHHIHSVGGVTAFDFMRVERPGRARSVQPLRAA